MSSSIPTESKPRSRRALLAGALGGLGAVVAGAVGRVGPVRGAGSDGAAVVVGGFYPDSRSQTTLANNANAERVLWVASNTGAGGGAGTAVTGFSANSVGVEGWSNSSTGIYGHSSVRGDGVHGASGSGIGVRATSGSGTAVWVNSTSGDGIRAFSGTGVPVYASSAAGVPAIFGWNAGTNAGVVGRSGTGEDVHESAQRTGVYGEAQLDEMGRGVWGSASAGRGVVGETQTGVGLYGVAAGGFALRTSGRLKADKVSGVATITAGNTSKTVTPGVDVTSSSFVLLTPKANIGSRGLWFTTNATANTFTIRMSSSRASGTKVAWLLLG